VTGLLTTARDNLNQALNLATQSPAGGLETSRIQESLVAVQTAVSAINNRDFFNARIALGMAVVHAGSARAAAGGAGVE
ncbi:MAG: hypothetical protein ACK4N5_11115, partial [Myxococcales bacterium]